MNENIAVQCGEKEIFQLVKKKAVTRNAIEGLVIPNKWDEKGNITGIAIHTNKEEVYLVAHNRMESDLLKHLHIKVGIHGKIMERLDGSKLIHVSSFQPIKGNINNGIKDSHGDWSNISMVRALSELAQGVRLKAQGKWIMSILSPPSIFHQGREDIGHDLVSVCNYFGR